MAQYTLKDSIAIVEVSNPPVNALRYGKLSKS